MTVSCTKENLIRGLEAVEYAVGRNATLPILAHVAFQAQKGKLILTATDLDIAVIASAPAKTEEEGKWTVPLRAFLGFVHSLPDGPVQLKKTGKQLVVKTETLQGKFQCGIVEDFPIVPDLSALDSLRLTTTPFLQALEEVIGATATTDTRPELTGVSIATEENTMYVAATDTFRLAVRVLAYEGADPISLILPQRSAQEMIRLFKNTESIEARFSENQCMISTRDTSLTSRLIEGTFPDYRAIIPGEAKATLRLDRDELIRKSEAASFFTSRLNDIRLRIQKNASVLEVATANPDIGEYNAGIDVREGNGTDEQEISVNLRYFLDGIRNIKTGEIQLETNGESKPLVFRPAEAQTQNCYLLMPIRSA